MKLFKNYRKLYKQQMNNNKVMNERNMAMQDRWIAFQKEKIEESRKLKEQVAKLKIELEDTTGFLMQEKEVSKALRKERTQLKRKLTKASKSVSEQQTIAVAYAIRNQAGKENATVEEIVDRLISEEEENA